MRETLPRVAMRLSVAMLLATGMWLYVQLVLIPYQKTQGPMRQSPRGNLSDLYPRWLGTRELLLHRRDPYSAEITREIQVGYYGRLLDSSRPGDPTDQQGFAYPVYVVLLLAPTIKLPFVIVREVFFWFLGMLTAGAVLLWLKVLRWRPSRSAIMMWVLLTLSCFPAIQGLKLQQLSLMVAALIAAFLWALSRQRFVLAGILLALATIKPQLVFLIVLWLFIWVLGNWRGRQRVVWSFAVSMAVLVGIGEILLPGWIGEFRLAIKDYYRYTGGGNSVLDVLLSPIGGKVTAAALVAMLVGLAWRYRNAEQESTAFQWSVCFTFATTLLVIPMFAPYNQLLLVPGLMMAIRAKGQLWERSRVSQFFCAFTAISILWPFLAGFCLVVALAFLPGTTVQKAWGLPFYPTFAIPIAIYAILLVARKVFVRERDPNEVTANEPARLAT